MAQQRPDPTPTPKAALNRSKFWAEATGAGLSCAFFVGSAVGVGAGIAGEIPTGGASTLLLLASWSGLMAGGFQCANGLVRVGHIMTNWNVDSLEHWDKNDTYQLAVTFADALGVSAGLAALPHQAKNLWAIVTRMRSLRSADLSIEALRRMNRVERFRVIARAFHDASRTPEGAHALVKAAREVKIGAQALQRRSTLSVNHSLLLREIVHKETLIRLNASLKEVFATVAGMGLSATPSSWTGSGSGVVHQGVSYVVNVIDAGEPNF